MYAANESRIDAANRKADACGNVTQLELGQTVQHELPVGEHPRLPVNIPDGPTEMEARSVNVADVTSRRNGARYTFCPTECKIFERESACRNVTKVSRCKGVPNASKNISARAIATRHAPTNGHSAHDRF
jgi:hypothetical protein